MSTGQGAVSVGVVCFSSRQVACVLTGSVPGVEYACGRRALGWSDLQDEHDVDQGRCDDEGAKLYRNDINCKIGAVLG